MFRLPITGIMYFGLRQIAALPAHRTREPKPQKNKAKVCKLRTGRPAVKKQGQDKRRYSLIDFKGIGGLAFFPRLHVARAFFFPGFFFVEMVLIKLYTMA